MRETHGHAYSGRMHGGSQQTNKRASPVGIITRSARRLLPGSWLELFLDEPRSFTIKSPSQIRYWPGLSFLRAAPSQSECSAGVNGRARYARLSPPNEELDGFDLRQNPLEDRKGTLADLLHDAGDGIPSTRTSLATAPLFSSTPALLVARASCRSA